MTINFVAVYQYFRLTDSAGKSSSYSPSPYETICKATIEKGFSIFFMLLIIGPY